MEYFATQQPPAGLDFWTEQLDAFVSFQVKAARPIVLVSSGGTTVPLERQMVRFLDNFSAGTRGSASAEYFLENGYAVLFLHRNYSLEPYSRHYSHTKHCMLDLLEVLDSSDGDIVAVQPKQQVELKKVLLKHKKAKENKLLLKIPFFTVTDYLFLLRLISQALAPLGSQAMFYLAAAVSDFFVPDKDMVEHKIQSSGGALSMQLSPVPKMLSPLCRVWCPAAFIVSFKLETDPAILEAKAKASLQTYGHELVIGNVLSTRKHTVKLVSRHGVEDIALSASEREPSSGVEIEQHIVARLVTLHKAFVSVKAAQAS